MPDGPRITTPDSWLQQAGGHRLPARAFDRSGILDKRVFPPSYARRTITPGVDPLREAGRFVTGTVFPAMEESFFDAMGENGYTRQAVAIATAMMPVEKMLLWSFKGVRRLLVGALVGESRAVAPALVRAAAIPKAALPAKPRGALTKAETALVGDVGALVGAELPEAIVLLPRQEAALAEQATKLLPELDAAFQAATGKAAKPVSANIARGLEGECLAADALVQDGHRILEYKPDARGTSLPGFDIVSLKADPVKGDVVYFVDNKALSRTGDVYDVSALAKNFEANKQKFLKRLEAALRDEANPEVRDVLERGAQAIKAGRHERIVTNANIVRGEKFVTGVSKGLSEQGIRFWNVMIVQGKGSLGSATKVAVPPKAGPTLAPKQKAAPAEPHASAHRLFHKQALDDHSRSVERSMLFRLSSERARDAGRLAAEGMGRARDLGRQAHPAATPVSRPVIAPAAESPAARFARQVNPANRWSQGQPATQPAFRPATPAPTPSAQTPRTPVTPQRDVGSGIQWGRTPYPLYRPNPNAPINYQNFDN